MCGPQIGYATRRRATFLCLLFALLFHAGFLDHAVFGQSPAASSIAYTRKYNAIFKEYNQWQDSLKSKPRTNLPKGLSQQRYFDEAASRALEVSDKHQCFYVRLRSLTPPPGDTEVHRLSLALMKDQADSYRKAASLLKKGDVKGSSAVTTSSRQRTRERLNRIQTLLQKSG